MNKIMNTSIYKTIDLFCGIGGIRKGFDLTKYFQNILSAEVDKFASANGMFKNQLIDSINEACEEFLDGEALIEEEDENYRIEESDFC